MEAAFYICQYPDSKAKEQLASELGLHRQKLIVWFQNRRARCRNDKSEERTARPKEPNLLAFSSQHLDVLKTYEESTRYCVAGYTPVFETESEAETETPEPQPGSLLPVQYAASPYSRLPNWPLLPYPQTLFPRYPAANPFSFPLLSSPFTLPLPSAPSLPPAKALPSNVDGDKENE